MSIGSEQEDGGIGESTPAQASEGFKPSAELTAKFEAVFADKDEAAIDAEDTGEVAPPPKATLNPQVRRQQQAAKNKEQQAELLAEGLTDEDGNDVEPKPAVEEDNGEDIAAKDDKEVVTEGDEAVATEGEGTSTIDPFHKWAALQSGWTPERIARLEKADPEIAAQTFESVANAYTALSRSQLGNLAPAQAGGTEQAGTQPAQSDAFPTPKLDKLIGGLAEFAEANGEDLAGFVKALNEEIVQPYKRMLAERAVEQQATSANEANVTFASVSKDFPDFYGKDKARNPVQADRVQTLATLADRIRSGAKNQGKSLSIGDCIKQAHAVLTADLRVANARKEVVSKVQSRSRQITARPTGRKATASPVKSRAAAAQAFEIAAAGMGIDFSEID